MRRQMLEIAVEVNNDGLIEISQPSGLDDPAMLIVSPEQVATLCQWLAEAAEEAKTQGKRAGA